MLRRRFRGQVEDKESKQSRPGSDCWRMTGNPETNRTTSCLPTIRESQLNQAVVRQQYTLGYGIGRAISCSITEGSFGYASVRPVRTNPSRS